MVGTRGYARGAAIVSRELGLLGAGAPRLVRQKGTASRGRTTRSDCLLFEDDLAAEPFGGLRERWDPAAVPVQSLPFAFDGQPAVGEARGAVVNLDSSEFQVADKPVPPGAIGFVVWAPGMDLASTARVAAGRGCIGLLVAPPRGAQGAEFDGASQRSTPAVWRELPIPCVPLRENEARQILERLRVRRVTGPDGKRISERTGPGPVIAQLNVEAEPRKVTEAEILSITLPGAEGVSGGVDLWVALDERRELSIGGSAALVAAIVAIRDHLTAPNREPTGPPVTFHFAPRSSFPVLDNTLYLSSVLAPAIPPATSTRSDGDLAAAKVPSRLFPIVGSTPARLDRRLGQELGVRLDAAAAWIAYSLPGGSDANRARGLDAWRTLAAPLQAPPSPAPR